MFFYRVPVFEGRGDLRTKDLRELFTYKALYAFDLNFLNIIQLQDFNLSRSIVLLFVYDNNNNIYERNLTSSVLSRSFSSTSFFSSARFGRERYIT